MPLGYNAFTQEVEDASALALGRNGWIQPTEEQSAASAVVPASQVVAATRADQALTQAGLAAAIAALPAAGGDIYTGPGTLTITANHSITKPVRFIGAGVGATTIQLSGAIIGFTIGDVQATFQDLTVLGDGSAGQTFILCGATSTKYIYLTRVSVSTAVAGIEIILDGDNLIRNWAITDSQFAPFDAGGDGFFLKDGGAGTMYIENSNPSGHSQVTGATVLFATNCVWASTLDTVNIAATSVITGCNFTADTIVLGAQCRVTNSTLNATTTAASAGDECQFDNCLFTAGTPSWTFGASTLITGCRIPVTATVLGNLSQMTDCRVTGTLTFGSSGTLSGSIVVGATIFGNSAWISSTSITGALTVGSSAHVTSVSVSGTLTTGSFCRFSACTLSTVSAQASNFFSACEMGAVTAAGASIKITGSSLTSFSSTSLNSHVIVGNVLTGAGANVTLASSSSCVVKENVTCQVTESGSSDSNTYANISTSSTIIGASSVVTDADKYAWAAPGTLTTTDDAGFARPSPQVSQMIRLLEVNVVTAPTGAAITVDFRKGTKSTGALGAVIGTVTVAINAFTGNVAVSPAVVLAPTEFITIDITQVGSTIAGADATMTARA